MKLREGNDCHNPAGEGGGQFCSAGSSGQTSDRPIPRNRTVDTDKVTLKDIPQKNPLPGTKVSFEGFVKPPWIDRAAELAGNQPGMSVHVSENWEDNPGHYRVTFAGTGVTGDLEVDGKDVYFNGLYVAHAGDGRLRDPAYVAEHGTGMKIMAGAIQAARDLGMTEFSLHAAGESGLQRAGSMNGYYTWPRLGFDGKPHEEDARNAEYFFALPKDSIKTVQDIFDIPEIPRGTLDDEGSDLARSSGRIWWKENGNGFRARFDLKPGSRSMKVLSSYMKHRFGQTINEANDCHNPAGSSKGGQFCSTPEPEDVFAQERFGSHAPGVTDQGRAFRDDLRKLAASLGHEVITMRDASDIYNFWHKMTSGSDADRAQWTATATAWAERNRNPRSVAARKRAAKKQAGRYWANITEALVEAGEVIAGDLCREPAGSEGGGQFTSCGTAGSGTATMEVPEVISPSHDTADFYRGIEDPKWSEGRAEETRAGKPPYSKEMEDKFKSEFGGSVAMQHMAADIATHAYETGAFFDRNGHLVYVGRGDKTSVTFQEDWVAGLDTRVLIHNHPLPYSFSAADISAALHFNLDVMYAITDTPEGFQIAEVKRPTEPPSRYHGFGDDGWVGARREMEANGKQWLEDHPGFHNNTPEAGLRGTDEVMKETFGKFYRRYFIPRSEVAKRVMAESRKHRPKGDVTLYDPFDDIEDFWGLKGKSVVEEAVEQIVGDLCRSEIGQFANCGAPSEGGGTAVAEPEVQEYPRTTEAQDMDRAIEKFLPGWTEQLSADMDVRVFRSFDSPMDSPFVKIDHRFWTNPEGSNFERQNAKGYLYAQMQNIAEMNRLAGGALQNVVFTLDPNPDDPYWNGVYGLTGFQSAASANSADGTVTFYGPTMVRGEGRARETFTHEVGHLVSLMGTNEMRADPDTRAELDQLGSRYEALFDEASKAKWGEAGMGNRATNYGSLTSYGSMNWREDFAELYKLAHIPLTQAEKDRYPVMRTRELAKELKPSNQLEAAIMDMGSRIWQVGGEWKDLVVPHHLTRRIEIANRLAGKDLVDPAFMARLRRWAADENPKLKDWWKQSPTPEEHIVAIGLERGRELMAEAVEQIAGDLCRSEIGQFASCAHAGVTGATAEAPPGAWHATLHADMTGSVSGFIEPHGYKLSKGTTEDAMLIFRKPGMPDIEIARDTANLEGMEKIRFIGNLNAHLFLLDKMQGLSGNSISRIIFFAGPDPSEPVTGFTTYAKADGSSGSLAFFNLSNDRVSPDIENTFTHEVGHLVSLFGKPGMHGESRFFTEQSLYRQSFLESRVAGFGILGKGGFTQYGGTNWQEDFAENYALAHKPPVESDGEPSWFKPQNELENKLADYLVASRFGERGIPPYIRNRMEILNKLDGTELVRKSYLDELDAWLKANPYKLVPYEYGGVKYEVMSEVALLIEREYCRDEKGRFSSGPCDGEGEGGTATATATEEKPAEGKPTPLTPEEFKAYQDKEFKDRMAYRANATEVMTGRGYTFEPGFDTDSAMVFSKPGSPSIIIGRDSLSIKPGSETETQYFASVNKHLDMIPQMQELSGGSIRWLRFAASEDPDTFLLGLGNVLAKASISDGGISFYNLAEPSLMSEDAKGTFVHEIGHLVNLFGTNAARGGIDTELTVKDLDREAHLDPAVLAARNEARKMQAQYDMAFGTAKRANFGVDGVTFGHDTRGGFTAYGSTNAGEDFAENFRLAHEPVNTEALTERGKEIFRQFKPANELEMSIGKFLVDIQDTVPYHVRARMEAMNALTGRELVRKGFLEDLDKYLKAHAIDAEAWNESIEVIAGNLCRSEVGQWAACDVGAETATTATSASPRVETEATKLPPELYAKVARVSPGQGSEVKLTSREIKEVLHDGTYGIIGAGRSPLDRDWTPEKERQRFDAIIAEAKAKGYRYMEAKGRYGQDEPSVFVFIPEAQKSDIIEMGKRFNQDSVIFGKEGKQRMVFTTGEKVGKGHPGRGYKNIVSTQQLDFFTEIPATDGPYKFALKFNFNRLVERLRRMFAPEILNEFIRKVSGGYRVVSHQTGKNFGTYKSREAAKRRLKQMARFR